MQTIINLIARFLPLDAQARILRNQMSHLVLRYQQAKMQIAHAKSQFENVRNATIDDFENAKKATLDRTMNAYHDMNEQLLDEEDDIEYTYSEAKQRLASKRESITEMKSAMESIGGEEFPLD